MVLYFSASGNSRFIAESAARSLQDDCVCLNEKIKNRDFGRLCSDTPFILVCPVFAWRIPRIVEEYLQYTALSGNDRVYLLMTTCGSSGNTGSYGEKLFRSLGKRWMGWYTFYMPGSYVAFMENPDLKHAKEMNRRAKEQLSELLPVIERGEKLSSFRVTLAGRFMSRAANPFFYRFIIGRPGFYATDDCVGCGECSRVCPLNNIEMTDGRPGWGNTCTHCMACVHRCPKRAVEFRKVSVGKNRYYNKGEIC